MELILVSANNKVDAVFAANDGLAQQTINAVEAAGLGQIPVSGQDATAEGIQNVALGNQTVSVYKPIQDEAGVTAAIALALRDGGTYEDAATSYQSTLASGGSGVAIIGINAADGTPADSATGDGVVPYVADARRDLHRGRRTDRFLQGERLAGTGRRDRSGSAGNGAPAPIRRR